MKNKFLLLSLLFVSAIAGAQSYGLPVWGNGPPQNDNTGRIVTYGFNNSPSIIGATKDTVKLYPNAFSYIVQPSDSIADTITYVIPVKPPQAFTGNTLRFYGLSANGASHIIKFRSGVYAQGVNFKYITASDSTLVLTSKKHFYVEFQYDGYYYIETVHTSGQ